MKNSAIIFLFQMTFLLRLLTFLISSLTVTLNPAFLDLFLYSDASILVSCADWDGLHDHLRDVP